MSPMIPLDTMLREATSSDFRDLVTRPTGAAVRNRVLVELADRPRTQALLDFSQIGLVDFSCADEVVAKLIDAVWNLPISRVVLVGVREDHAEAIDHALARHGLLIVALEAGTGRPHLLGGASDDLQATFMVLIEIDRPGGLAEVALRLGWPTERARLALDGLVAARCALATVDDQFEMGALS